MSGFVRCHKCGADALDADTLVCCDCGYAPGRNLQQMLPVDALFQALMDAAASFEALASAGYRKTSKKYNGLDDLIDVRGFATSRAMAARQAIERYRHAVGGLYMGDGVQGEHNG